MRWDPIRPARRTSLTITYALSILIYKFEIPLVRQAAQRFLWPRLYYGPFRRVQERIGEIDIVDGDNIQLPGSVHCRAVSVEGCFSWGTTGTPLLRSSSSSSSSGYSTSHEKRPQQVGSRSSTWHRVQLQQPLHEQRGNNWKSVHQVGRSLARESPRWPT